jgi:hypothetical protein
MPKMQYETINLSEATRARIDQANAIIETYAADGYDLTLRQLYYQFVARGLIPNKQSEYKKLGNVISKGRRAGLIDWEAIVDRTRDLRSLSTWESPASIVAAVASQFRCDWWATQPTYVEVWFEKDALLGVFERAANARRVPYFSCRGYTSDSEIWSAAQRLRRESRRGGRRRDVVILHFGDHDPSGLDMTRDIRERLVLLGAPRTLDVRRLALNMDQITQYDPPPNPAKETDSRFAEYSVVYGDESWELDALEPSVLATLVADEVDTLVEAESWDNERLREKRGRAELAAISDEYAAVVEQFAPDVTVSLDDLDEEDLDEEEDEGEEDDA